MLQGTRAAVEDGIKQGKSLAQLKQERVLARWVDLVVDDAVTKTVFRQLDVDDVTQTGRWHESRVSRM